MRHFLDLDFPYSPLFSPAKEGIYPEENIINTNLVIMPAKFCDSNSELIEKGYSSLNSAKKTIIYLIPTLNYVREKFFTFSPQNLAILNQNIKIDYDFLENFQKNFSIEREDLNFEMSEIMKYHVDYLNLSERNYKIFPIFYSSKIKENNIMKFLTLYYGKHNIVILLNFGSELNNKTLYKDNLLSCIEDNSINYNEINVAICLKQINELIKFSKKNNYSLIRLGFNEVITEISDNKYAVYNGTWLLYEGSKVEYLKKFYLKEIKKFINHNLRQHLHLACDTTYILPEVFDENFYVEISIEKNGQVRGVTQQKIKYESLEKGLMRHSFSAAFSDDRFPPLKPEELPDIKFYVSIRSKHDRQKTTISF